MSDVERQVTELLERKGSDGALAFSDDEVREAVPLLCLGLKRALPGIELPEFAVQCVGEVAAKAGAGEDTPPDQILEKLAAYYEANTSPLIKELEIVMRALVGANAGDAARALAGVIGASSKLKPLEQKERPKGTIAAGPAARFQMLDNFPSKK